jgi:hypothetical protein
MATRLNVDANRLFGGFTFLAIALLLIGFATVGGGDLAVFSLAALAGAMVGAIVAAVRSEHGLGASLTSEREPRGAGTINYASIPVIGIGGLGLVVMAAGVAWVVPGGPQLVIWSTAGGILGAGALLTWRHFHGGTPFEQHPQDTLHLR